MKLNSEVKGTLMGLVHSIAMVAPGLLTLKFLADYRVYNSSWWLFFIVFWFGVYPPLYLFYIQNK